MSKTQGLCSNHRVLFLSYESLVSAPELCVDLIMKRAGGHGVWAYFSTDANLASLNRPLSPTLSPKIQKRCDAFYHELYMLGKRDFPDTQVSDVLSYP